MGWDTSWVRNGPQTSHGSRAVPRAIKCLFSLTRPSDAGLLGLNPIVVVPHLELGGGGHVDVEFAPWMHLQSTTGVHAGHRALDGLGHGAGLVRPVGQQDDFPAFQDRAHSHGDGVDRHVLDLLEETGIVLDGRPGQGFQPGPRTQGAGRLVEADVAIRADAQDLNVDAADFLDSPLIPIAERPIVAGGTGGNVDVLPGNVDVLKEVLVHEVMVALRVVGHQAHILVEVEGRHLREVQSFFLVHAGQFLVQTQGARAGGQADHGVRLAVEDAGHFDGRQTTDVVIRLGNDDFHGVRFLLPRVKGCRAKPVFPGRSLSGRKTDIVI